MKRPQKWTGFDDLRQKEVDFVRSLELCMVRRPHRWDKIGVDEDRPQNPDLNCFRLSCWIADQADHRPINLTEIL